MKRSAFLQSVPILVICLLCLSPAYSATMTGGLFSSGSIAFNKDGLQQNTDASASNFNNNSTGIFDLKLGFDNATGIGISDFSFHYGNNSDVSTWASLTPSISILASTTTNVTLSLNDPIVDGWLEVQYVTGGQSLYFGNLVGDASLDGYLTPNDALRIINHLNSGNGLDSGDTDYKGEYDINGDGSISPIDALLVINKLNSADAILELAGGPFQDTPTGTGFTRLDEILDFDTTIFNPNLVLDLRRLDLDGDYELVMRPVPEPATMLLFGTGLIGLAGFRRKKTKN